MFAMMIMLARLTEGDESGIVVTRIRVRQGRDMLHLTHIH
jgi:hypothetical protein